MTIEAHTAGLAAQQQWTAVLRSCLTRRLRPHEVEEALLQCQKSHFISGENLVGITFGLSIGRTGACDPLLPSYLASFIKASLISPADLLSGLLIRSSYAPTAELKGVDDAGSPETASLSTQETILSLLAATYTSTEHPRSKDESVQIFRAVLNWVQALNAFVSSTQSQDTMMQPLAPETSTSFENIAAFLVILLTNIRVKRHLAAAIPKNAKQGILSALTTFSTTLAQWSTSPIYAKLQLATKLPPLADKSREPPWDLSSADIVATVDDLPINRSRAGLYVYLNATICARPLFDDMHLNSFLQVLYQNDDQTLICDLVVAAFDVLANALQRHEPEHVILCHRSLVVDKLQSILTNISIKQMYSSGSIESSIQLALGRLETHPFPPLSSDSAGFNDTLRDTRHELINACFRHQLMSEATATAILGETPLVKPSKPLLNKQQLTQQLLSQPQKPDELVSELNSLTGVAGTISSAMVEALGQAAVMKEISTVKSLCSAMYKALPMLDIMLQHTRLIDILTPLCNVLNEWTHDEDQSELQPAYEDFATIMLLTLAVIHRYDVQVCELDTAGAPTFVINCLTKGAASKTKSELTSEEIAILDKWIKGLFAVDDKGESSGIRDDIMSGCSPQTFHLLVPTLFEQIVLACRAKAIAPSTLKGGLEFLLEPFLLPSLIGGLTWLSNHVWTSREDTEIALQIMQKLIKPTSMSGDAHVMHQTILGILYKDVRPCLQEIDKRMSKGKDVAQLVAVLKPHADSQHEILGTVSEIRAWCEPFGTLQKTVSNLVVQLSTWTTQAALNPVPPAYSHRLFETALDRVGAADILDALLEVVTLQSVLGLGPAALEVATALICAPNTHNTFQQNPGTPSKMTGPPDRLSLRRTLSMQCEDAHHLLSLEHTKAETLIRLHRLVESRATVIPLPISVTMDMTATELMSGVPNSAATEAENAAAAAAVAAAVASVPLESADQAALDAATAGLPTTLDQGLALGSNPAADLDMGDAAGLNLDLANDLFNADGQVSFDLGLDTSGMDGLEQQLQVPRQSGGGLLADDDIFAGLDLGGIGDMETDDFTFS